MMVRIEFTDEILRITGDGQSTKDIKVIEIPRDEAIYLIEKDCKGKIENLFGLLNYDEGS